MAVRTGIEPVLPLRQSGVIAVSLTDLGLAVVSVRLLDGVRRPHSVAELLVVKYGDQGVGALVQSHSDAVVTTCDHVLALNARVLRSEVHRRNVAPGHDVITHRRSVLTSRLRVRTLVVVPRTRLALPRS